MIIRFFALFYSAKSKNLLFRKVKMSGVFIGTKTESFIRRLCHGENYYSQVFNYADFTLYRKISGVVFAFVVDFDPFDRFDLFGS